MYHCVTRCHLRTSAVLFMLFMLFILFIVSWMNGEIYPRSTAPLVSADMCSPPCACWPPGLSPTGAFRGDSDPGGGGEAYHPEGEEPAPAPVRSAGLRVCPPHPGGQPPSHRPPLQQLQRAVPEQLSRFWWRVPRLCQGWSYIWRRMFFSLGTHCAERDKHSGIHHFAHWWKMSAVGYDITRVFVFV